MSENKTKIDNKVLELFNKVKEKQRKISANERVSWETNCSFGYSTEGVHDRVNLQVITDLAKLADIWGYLVTKEFTYEQFRKDFSFDLPLKWLGYKISDWQKDIKTRVNQLQLSNERKELKALETRLDSLITVDQRREMELAAIEKELA